MRRNLVMLVVATALLAGCGDPDEETAGLVMEDPAGHVHAIGVDPGDQSIVVASHTGLFRAARGASRATRLSDERRDVMGFSVEGPGRYAGSGHPDPQAGGPSSVGFIRSADRGQTWQTVALSGEADLHVLELARGRVYGYNALSGEFLRSEDGGRSWDGASLPPVIDIAVDPADPDVIVASAEDGLLRSTNAGRTWRPAGDAPLSHLVWTADGLVLLGLDGVVRQASAPQRPLTQVGRLPGPPSAATSAGREILAAYDDVSVLSSRDGGRTWAKRLGGV